MADHEDDVAHCAVVKRAKVQMELQHLEEGSEDKSIVVQHDCARMVPLILWNAQLPLALMLHYIIYIYTCINR